MIQTPYKQKQLLILMISTATLILLTIWGDEIGFNDLSPTTTIAIIGLGLGIINTLRNIQQDRVVIRCSVTKYRAQYNKYHDDLDPEFISIRITNMSKFPICIDYFHLQAKEFNTHYLIHDKVIESRRMISKKVYYESIHHTLEEHDGTLDDLIYGVFETQCGTTGIIRVKRNESR